MSPVALVGNISGCPGGLLVRRRGRGRWRRTAAPAAAGLLHFLQAIREETGGELRRPAAPRLRQLRRTLRAGAQDVGRGVRLLPQPRAVHQQRRGVLLRQVRVLRHFIGRDGPGDRAASQGVTSTQTQDTGQERRRGTETDLH